MYIRLMKERLEELPEEGQIRIVEILVQYLQKEPGAHDSELRSFLWDKHRTNIALGKDFFIDLRLDAGVTMSFVHKGDPGDTFNALVEFYGTNDPDVPKYQAMAYLRHLGLSSPRITVFREARRLIR